MIAVLRFLILIPLGFVVSCFVAAFALVWPFIDTAGAATGDPVFWLQAVLGLLAQSAQIGSTAVVPWALFMVVTECLGWRSVLLHMAAGLAGSFAVIRTAYVGALPHASVQTAMLVAGLAFALVYWLLAGRSAGLWRGRRPLPPETMKSPPGP